MKNELFSLQGKIACLTGGTGLIGKILAERLVAAGAVVHVGTRDPKRVIKTTSKKVFFKKLDIGDEESIKLFIRDVVDQSKKIDVWVNCAWPRTEYQDVSLEAIDSLAMGQDINAHLIGYFNCCRHAFIRMKKQKSGVIVNLGSIYGEVSPDFRIYKNTTLRNVPTYSLIKAGVHVMTRYFAVRGSEYNIRVNAVAPGGIFDGHSRIFVEQYSNRVPMRRMADPQEISGPVIFLASQASSYMTGQVLFVDGGLTIW